MRKGGRTGKKGRFFLLLIAAAVTAAVSGCTEESGVEYRVRRMTYLYPQEAGEVNIQLKEEGEPFCAYPLYDGEWNVIARPDGTMTNLKDGQEYSCLFREDMEEDTAGETGNMQQGFVVKGEDTAAFLQESFSKMGLTASEYNDLIVYWLPHMQKNPWNLIMLRVEEGREERDFHISPEPDYVLRVAMVYRRLENPMTVDEPEIGNLRFSPRGFTVVEWSGAELP